MSIAYRILCVISLFLIGVCLAVDRKKDICLLLLFISVFVCNLGQFLISVAPSLSFALNGNRIAYLGQVFLPLLMLKMILNLCSLNYKKWLLPTPSLISIAVLFVTLTPGFFPCYYNRRTSYGTDFFGRILCFLGSHFRKRRLCDLCSRL